MRKKFDRQIKIAIWNMSIGKCVYGRAFFSFRWTNGRGGRTCARGGGRSAAGGGWRSALSHLPKNAFVVFVFVDLPTARRRRCLLLPDFYFCIAFSLRLPPLAAAHMHSMHSLCVVRSIHRWSHNRAREKRTYEISMQTHFALLPPLCIRSRSFHLFCVRTQRNDFTICFVFILFIYWAINKW